MDTLNLDWPLGDSSIGVVTLNRPDALNAMNTLMIRELLDLFREQAYNDSLRCMVITGAGTRAFSTGGDLKERNGMGNEQWRYQHHLIEDAFKALWEFPVPILAAVEGFAYAGGCELALGADFIVASASAQFALKEVTRGILPGGGGLQNLARSIGIRRAREMIYTGRVIDAETACSWGLVNRVVPAGEARESALEIAQQIAEAPRWRSGWPKSQLGTTRIAIPRPPMPWTSLLTMSLSEARTGLKESLPSTRNASPNGRTAKLPSADRQASEFAGAKKQ